MASPTRWRAAIVGAAAGGALLIAAVLVAWQAPQGAGGWAALLEKPRGGTGWSRLPGHGVPTLWHEEPAAAAKSGGAGWGRLPEHHKPRLRRAVAGPPKRPAHLTDELPAVYHLPTDRAAGAKVPKADRLAAEKLARNLHAYHKEAMAAPREGRAGLPAGLRREEKALPPGFHVLEPGQRLPKGAKIVKAPPLPAGYHVLKPGMKLPKGAKIVEHPPQLAAVRRAPVRRRGMKVPRVGQNNHMLDEDAAEEGGEEEGGEEPCECEEGDEECECPPAPRDVPGPCECAEDDEECDCVPEPPPTPAERLEVAFESHKKSRAERITARELQAKARNTERDAVTLIQQGWQTHKTAEASMADAKAKMEEADEMVANANRVLDLANSQKSEALATQEETIAEEFKEASAEKAQKAEEYQAEADDIKAEQEAAAAEQAGGDEAGEEPAAERR
eukprot:Tamp_17778.p1 GENE.Tamp_17778~~Tamp_17778.p1  ORF type:complete len:446 (+),score=123.32 Tamp_17778:1-1338(+)